MRNEVIAKTLYLCKNVETFGSGIRKIYSLCNEANVSITYTNNENDFMFEFSRIDRNIMPDGTISGTINGTISERESVILKILKEKPRSTVNDLVLQTKKSLRTVNRILTSLKAKKLIERIGSNKTGYWKVK